MQASGNPVPTFMGKFIKQLVDNFIFQLLLPASAMFIPTELQQKAFSQIACPDSGRVESLQPSQHCFQFRLRSLYSCINLQLVRQRGKFLFQQAVIFQRTDKISHQFPFTQCQVTFVHLLRHLFVERCRVAIVHRFRTVFPSPFLQQIIRHIVRSPIIIHRLPHLCRTIFIGRKTAVQPGSLAPGRLCIYSVIDILRRRIGILMASQTFFQRSVVYQFVFHALFQLRNGHFQQPHLQHLLRGQRLDLLHRLRLN